MANQPIIDDRRHGSLISNLGNQWRLITDQVMGGTSNGELRPDRQEDRPCLRLTGTVSTRNNGGFVQMALDLGILFFQPSRYPSTPG